jgi:hypothetical protein
MGMMSYRLAATLAMIYGAVLGLACPATPGTASADDSVAIVPGNGRLAIVIDGLPVAMYCYADETITRPYFAHVRAPNGIQVTRNHPPLERQDLMDHPTFHPGIWMSFGDISGSDYWRLAARVRHAGFVEPAQSGEGSASFAVRNQYIDGKDPSKLVCEEVARYTIAVRPAGFLLIWDSTFSSEREFAFGDQEEMGVGFRVATPLRVGKSGKDEVPAGHGAIIDSNGRKNGEAVWGKSAAWCDFSGMMAGERVGLAIFCHTENFRPSRYHARDYGLLQANPFGQQSFDQGEKSLVVVKPGEKLRLRYGILIHSSPPNSDLDLAAAYQDYLEFSEMERHGD